MPREDASPPVDVFTTEPFVDEEEDLVMACCDLDAYGRIVRVNRAARHVFAIEAGRDVPVMLATYIEPEHLSRFYRTLADVIRDQTSGSVVVSFAPPGSLGFRARLDVDAPPGSAGRLCRVTIVSLSARDAALDHRGHLQ